MKVQESKDQMVLHGAAVGYSAKKIKRATMVNVVGPTSKFEAQVAKCPKGRIFFRAPIGTNIEEGT